LVKERKAAELIYIEPGQALSARRYAMNDMDDYYAFKNCGGESGGESGNGGGGKGFGCGWIVIVIVVLMLIFFIADGASRDAIETLLSLGILAFLFFKWIST